MLKIINIDINPTYSVDNGVIRTKHLGDGYEINTHFGDNGELVYRVYATRNSVETLNCPSLEDAKAYIERFMLKVSLEHIKMAAEILEDK